MRELPGLAPRRQWRGLARPVILLAMERVFSGVQSSGSPHIGNYFGAFRQWVADQQNADSVFCVVDLHALTVEHDPALLRQRTLDTAAWLFCERARPGGLHGLRPEPRARARRVVLAARVHRHLRRAAAHDPVQGQVQGQRSVRAGLLTYPVLMAADILLYDTDRVPVETISASISNLPATSPSVSTAATARPSSSQTNRAQGRRQGDGPPAPRAQDVQVGHSPLGTIDLVDDAD